MLSMLILALVAGATVFSPVTHGAAHASRAVLFGAGTFSTQYDDAHITFVPDGDTAYFLRNSPDFAYWTVLVSHRRQGHWQPPAVASFSGRYNDADVFVAPDGSRLLFISNRPVEGAQARPDTDIWSLTRTTDGWGRPKHLAALSSPGNEWFPSMSRDGWLYFGSEREGGYGKSDLWRARWNGTRFLEPENLGPEINTRGQEIEAYADPAGRYLIFAAKGRPSSAGAYDLYVTYRCEGHWTSPKALGGGVNSAGWDFGARVSPDGRYLYFTSNRSTFRQGDERYDMAALTRHLASPGNGLRDIYRVDMETLGIRSPCAPDEG